MTIAIVTGASRGLGLALAEKLAKECKVLITIARQDEIETISSFAKQFGCQHIHFSANLSDMEQVSCIARQIDSYLNQSFDNYLLINNAGELGPIKQFNGLTSDKAQEIAHTFNLNIASVITLTSVFLTACQQHSGANIQVINISSGAARSAYPGWAVYCASKAALDRYSEVAQLEAPFAKIVSLAPGVLDTGMQANIRNSTVDDFPNLQRFKDLHTNQALSAPYEVADKILKYRLSDDFATQTLADIRLIKD
ncbi:short-chain dehydrogenase [Pelistega indica]|uniref:Short-chain dehydrogenase n=1 Tax=Pelistega indica TaxID=1414851 RepID=V8G8R6_9BURK|nr:MULTISPECIES: SDR family NAD(P)-dependent oxidoreductase [Pelistega]ETD72466.1 short-chain dehydrogenase [Pelistega indica]